MGFIYIIENKVNHLKYIGATSTTIKQRMHSHRFDKNETMISKSIQKYGWNSFEYGIIEETNNLEEREKYWIKHYNTLTPNGYNMNAGGTRLFGEENNFYGKKHSSKLIKYLSKLAAERIGVLNPFFGKHHSKLAKSKISDGNSIQVIMKDVGGNVLKTFKNAIVAGQYCTKKRLSFGKTPNSDIHKACKEGSKAFGFYWEYGE